MRKRLVGWFVLIPLCVVLILFALANRHVVPFYFDPVSPGSALLPSYEVPLFVIMYAMLLAGVVLGGMAVWVTQGKHRKAERAFKRESEKLQRDVDRLHKAETTRTQQTALAKTDDYLELD